MSAHATRSRPPLAARVASAALLLVGLLALVQSRAWWGARFPGFFLLPNRVVPSAGLPGWGGTSEGQPLYQQTVVAVDDVRVATGAEAYGRAAAHRVGDPVRFTFARSGAPETRTFPLQRFTAADYLL